MPETPWQNERLQQVHPSITYNWEVGVRTMHPFFRTKMNSKTQEKQRVSSDNCLKTDGCGKA
jgi:hypothetical protein